MTTNYWEFSGAGGRILEKSEEKMSLAEYTENTERRRGR